MLQLLRPCQGAAPSWSVTAKSMGRPVSFHCIEPKGVGWTRESKLRDFCPDLECVWGEGEGGDNTAGAEGPRAGKDVKATEEHRQDLQSSRWKTSICWAELHHYL